MYPVKTMNSHSSAIYEPGWPIYLPHSRPLPSTPFLIYYSFPIRSAFPHLPLVGHSSTDDLMHELPYHEQICSIPDFFNTSTFIMWFLRMWIIFLASLGSVRFFTTVTTFVFAFKHLLLHFIVINRTCFRYLPDLSIPLQFQPPSFGAAPTTVMYHSSTCLPIPHYHPPTFHTPPILHTFVSGFSTSFTKL